MKALIRRWLGIDEILASIEDAVETQQLAVQNLAIDVQAYEAQARPLVLALGRMIAQKDKYFVVDELDPQRRKESDELGSRAIQRLMSEHSIRNTKHPR